jgi:ribonuclease HII
MHALWGVYAISSAIYYLSITAYHKHMILGIDEVGRGPWAGPLVVGAVVLVHPIEGLTDSKKLSKKQLLAYDQIIRDSGAVIGLGWVNSTEIDEIGLSKSLQIATIRAVEQIDVAYHEIIIDGTVNFLRDTSKGQYVTTLKKADLLIPSVSAASIVAKVARDAYMAEQDDMYPGYGFASHVGYGTAAHSAAINTLGVTPLHRLSFAPLVKYQVTSFAHNQPKVSTVFTTKQIGDSGEDAAVAYIEGHGHRVIERNWKTKFCEIDIVSTDGKVIYFIEVKYRKDTQQGGGIAAITPKKLRQMKFAAEYYALKNDKAKTDLRLIAVSVVGQPPSIEHYLEIS